jgi:hypothetical protein
MMAGDFFGVLGKAVDVKQLLYVGWILIRWIVGGGGAEFSNACRIAVEKTFDVHIGTSMLESCK